MAKLQTILRTQPFLIVAPIVLVLVIVLMGLLPSPSNTKLRDATVALTIIAAVSVGIERVLEGFWTYVGLTINSWWPLNVISQDITNMATNLDKELKPFYLQLTTAVDDAISAGKLEKEQIDAATKEIDDFKNYINQLKTLAPGDQTALAIASKATQLVSQIQQKFQTLDTVATTANQAINGFANFIVTPADNLGRRIISLYLGIYLGLVVAWLLGLDLLQVILTTTLAFHLGIILTGLVMGLGSSPTHEVIQVLQNWKTNLKTGSGTTTSNTTTSSGG